LITGPECFAIGFQGRLIHQPVPLEGKIRFGIFPGKRELSDIGQMGFRLISSRRRFTGSDRIPRQGGKDQDEEKKVSYR
jgi:hypothetical protein